MYFGVGRSFEPFLDRTEFARLPLDATKYVRDPPYPYLGASPDGLVGDDAIAELKCPHTLKDEAPTAIILKGKFPFLKIEGDAIVVNKQHDFYLQVCIDGP